MKETKATRAGQSGRSDGGAADERLAALTDWIRSLPGTGEATLEPASADASFRRYFRVDQAGTTSIAMDAPPPMEDCRPFVAVARQLEAMSLNAPRILATDFERGFLLMTDLGDRTYLDVLAAEPAQEQTLYDDAIDALLRIQQEGDRFRKELPPYDEALLARELALFHDWLCGRHLGIDFDAGDEKEWLRISALLIDNALVQHRVFVHRDYHSRNLMVTPSDNPGIIDFQDAVDGPLTYDLASLLKDCYVRLDESRIERCLGRFYGGLDRSITDSIDQDAFRRQFELMGVQRHLKAAGIFARLLHRDGKNRYMADVPRTLDYIAEAAASHPELRFLSQLLKDRVMPALQGSDS